MSSRRPDSVAAIDVLPLRLPMRWGFGHAMARRQAAFPRVVRLRLGDGTVGHGEALPRTYVSGEDGASVERCLREELGPRLVGRSFPDLASAARWLTEEEAVAVRERSPAAFCGLELALLDAVGRYVGRSVFDLLGPPRGEPVYDGAVVGFLPERFLELFLSRLRSRHPRVVKVKVGREDDLPRLARVRAVLGDGVDLRVDANGAWTAAEAVRRAGAFADLGVTVFEQPVPGRDLEGLVRVAAAVPMDVLADESLVGTRDALYLLERAPRCRWNLRVGKCGGLLATLELARLAERRGVTTQLGILVGESGLLRAAGRIVAAVHPAFEHLEAEGTGNLVEDLLAAPLPPLPDPAAPGLGVEVCSRRLEALAAEEGADEGDVTEPGAAQTGLAAVAAPA